MTTPHERVRILHIIASAIGLAIAAAIFGPFFLIIASLLERMP